MTTHSHRTVLILGGGINGAAIARQLVDHSVSVWLVDRGDIAGGTTAASSRLIHGGLRYLEYGELGLVRESLRERARLLQEAPHLVRPLRLFIPVANRLGGLTQAATRFLRRRDRRSRSPVSRGRWLVESGLLLYDWFSRHGHVPARRSAGRVGEASYPAVNPHLYRWICEYYDAQALFPERLVVEMCLDAQALARQRGVEFRLLTYHTAQRDGARIAIRPVLAGNHTAGGQEYVVEPTAVINATGAWVDESLQKLQVPSRRLIGGTKGSHLLTYHQALRQHLELGGVYAEAADGRPVFLLPLGNATLVGTTDLIHLGPVEEARTSAQEVEYLIDAVRRVFPDVQLSGSDICLHCCGVRPLPYVDAATPGGITRRHFLYEHQYDGPPLFSVIGGKLTTCGSLAYHTVCQLARWLDLPQREQRLERPFPGAQRYPTDEESEASEIASIARTTNCTKTQVQSAWRLLGTRSHQLLSHCGDRAVDHENLAGTQLPYGLVREIIRQEWVVRLSDLVERRLMLLYDRELPERALRQLATLMVQEQRLDDQQVAAEIDACRSRLGERFGRELSEES